MQTPAHPLCCSPFRMAGGPMSCLRVQCNNYFAINRRSQSRLWNIYTNFIEAGHTVSKESEREWEFRRRDHTKEVAHWFGCSRITLSIWLVAHFPFLHNLLLVLYVMVTADGFIYMSSRTLLNTKHDREKNDDELYVCICRYSIGWLDMDSIQTKNAIF